MEKINIVLDGSNKDASNRLKELIKEIEHENKEARP